VPGKGIAARESFLFLAKCASDLLLANVVDGILMSGEVIRSREYCSARFSSSRVDPVASVWTCLRISFHKLRCGHARTDTRCDAWNGAVRFAFVLLKLLRRRESMSTSLVGTTVSAGASR